MAFYELLGVTNTGELLYRDNDGTTGGSPKCVLSRTSGAVVQYYDFLNNAWANLSTIASVDWGNFYTALGTQSDGDGAGAHFATITDIAADGLSATWMNVHITDDTVIDFDTDNAGGQADRLYFDGSNFILGSERLENLITTLDTVADAILVDTGTTLPAALTYDKDDVSPERTWSWPANSGRVQSPQIVRVHPSFDGTLAFDLSNLLNEGAGISTVTSVTVSPSGPTVTGPNGGASPTKNSNNTKVLFDIDGGQSDSTDYTFTCTVTTTDSDDALVHTGLMQSRST